MKMAVQCDFDGTITEEDVSFLLLDTFAEGNWREILKEHSEGKISVGVFNRRAFDLVKADQQTQLDFIFQSEHVKIRPGFKELVNYCQKSGYRFTIVSNGLIFYISALLKNLGLNDLEVYAAGNEFHPGGMKVCYISPDGKELDDGFKESYTRLFMNEGYRVAYVGNGVSDIHSARLSQKVFATGPLITRWEEETVEYTPFNDLFDVIRGLESIKDTKL